MPISFKQALIVLNVLVCATSSQLTMAEGSDYENGLAAYISGDYQQARSSWLRAAKSKDPKAMFNLGLLHEKGHLADASSDQADNWFIQAGNYGYVAADYHLAMRWLAQGGRDEEANARIKKAADAGYVPAKHRLARLNSKSVAGPIAKAVPSTKASVPNKTRPEKVSVRKTNPAYLTERWITAKPAANWTIQMLAFKDRKKVESFIDQHGLKNRAAYFTETSTDGVLYKLIYGSYQTKNTPEFTY